MRNTQHHIAYLVTCAHVVLEIGREEMRVRDAGHLDNQVELVGAGENGLDLAVVKVRLEHPGLRRLPFAAEDPKGPLRVEGFRPSADGFRRVPLKAVFGRI